MDLLHLRR